MSQFILDLLVIVLPAGFANMVPPFAMKVLPKFTAPADFGLEFRGRRILGEHKTIRGFLFGTLFAGLLFQLLDYSGINSLGLPWFYGYVVGFSALVGDSIKSFVKRQLDISPGKAWFPFDQIDWIIASLLIMPFFGITYVWYYVAFLGVGFGGHLLAKVLGFYLGLNDTKI